MRSPLLVIGFLLVIALCTALVAPFFIDWSGYRERLEAYARDAIGRQVSIEDGIELRLLPSPRLVLGGVSIANVVDASGGDLMTAETVDIELSLSPLLKGQLEVTSIVVDGAVFNLEHMGSGTGNWHMTMGSEIGDYLAADNIMIREAKIRDSVVYLRDSTRSGSAELTDVDLTITAQSLSGPFTAEGSLRHEGVPVEVVIATGRRRSDGEMRLSVKLVQDGGYGPTYSFDGGHRDDGLDASLFGRLTVVHPQPDPNTAPEDRGLPYVFRADVNGTLASFALEDISVLLDESDATTEITGAVRADIGEFIEVTADFNIGHLDVDALLERTGIDSADLVPELSLIDALPDYFDRFPHELDAVLRIESSALTMMGDTIEGARFQASYAEYVLNIDELSGRIPGFGKLDVEGAVFDATQDNPALQGRFELATRDTRSVLSWLAPGITGWLEETPRRFRGPSTLVAELAVDGETVAISNGRLEHRDMVATGGFLYDPGERPRVELSLNMETLKLDHLFPVQAAEMSEDMAAETVERPFDALRGVAERALGETLPALVEGYDGRVEVQISEVGWRRFRGGAVELRAELDDGTLLVDKLSIADFHDLDFSVNARLAWEENRPQGAVWLELASERPQAFFDLIEWDEATGVSEAEAEAALERAAPFHAGVALSARDVSGENRMDFEADVEAAEIELALHGTVLGDMQDMGATHIDVEGKVFGPDSDALMVLLGLSEDAGETGAGGRSELATFSANGVPREGASTTLQLNLYGAETRLAGVSRIEDGQLFSRSNFSLESVDPAPLYDALGLVHADNAEVQDPIDIEGVVSSAGRFIEIHSLGGRIGDNVMGFAGSLDLTNEITGLVGNLTLSRASLPWVFDHAFGSPQLQPHTLLAIEDAIGTWRSVPFGAYPFERLAAEVGFAVGEAQVSRDTFISSLSGHLSLEDEHILLQGLAGEMFGGSLSAEAEIVDAGGQVSAEVTYEVTDADVAYALADQDGVPLLRGLVSMSGGIAGHGRSPLGLMSSLNGGGSFALHGGSLTGLDPATFAETLNVVVTSEELDQAIVDVLRRGETPLPHISGDYTVNEGVVRFDPVDVTAEAAQIAGRVSFDIPAWQVRSSWNIALLSHPDAPVIEMEYGGDPSAAYRDYDTAGMRSYLVVRGFLEGVQRLEDLRRQQEEEIARIEELERQALEQAERLAREEEERRAREEQERLAREDGTDLIQEDELAAPGEQGAGAIEGATLEQSPVEPPLDEPLPFDGGTETGSVETSDESADAPGGSSETETIAAVPLEPELAAPSDEGASRGPALEGVEAPDVGLSDEESENAVTEEQVPEVDPGAGQGDPTDLASQTDPEVIIIEIPEDFPEDQAGDGSGPIELAPDAEPLAPEVAEEPRGGGNWGGDDQGLFSDDHQGSIR